jgi:hypothetical protein
MDIIGMIFAAGPMRVGRHVFVLLSADSAVLGSWLDGVLDKHKVFTGYTVRRSQGKSQLAHMRRCIPVPIPHNAARWG